MEMDMTKLVPHMARMGRYLWLDGSTIPLPVPASRFQFQQGGKPSAAADQLLWWTRFHDLTGLHHQDPVGFLGRGQAMGHGKHCVAAANHRPMQGGAKGGLAGAIARGSGL